MCSNPEALPLPRLLELACEPGKVREEVVDLVEIGVRAGWRVQKPGCKFDLTVVVQGKMRCDLVRVPEGAGQAEVHALFLEPRPERAAHVIQDGLRLIVVGEYEIEAAMPVT